MRSRREAASAASEDELNEQEPWLLLVLSHELAARSFKFLRGRLKHVRELFWHYWVPVLVMLTLIKMESTDTFSGAHTGHFLQHLFLVVGIHLGAQQLDLINLVLRKCGHAAGYGALGFCWMMLLRGTYWLQHDYAGYIKTAGIQVRRLWWRAEWAVLAVLFTFVVAASDELHQMSIASRTGTWRDVVLDTSAAVIAVSLVWIKASITCQTEELPLRD